MNDSSPFGQYAGIVALVTAVGVIAAWIATVIVPAIPSNQLLDSLILLIIGAIFGTGAGARVIANGAERKADIANRRLDAVNAPPAAAVQPTPPTDTASDGGFSG